MFSFNFLPSEGQGDEETPPGESSRPGGNGDSASAVQEDDFPASEIKPFAWSQNLHAQFLQNFSSPPPSHDWISLTDDGKTSDSLARVRERSTSSNIQGTDLIPGVYEGGDVVWECSLDLCRYLSQNHVQVKGFVLELGCGHGLPGCWVLRQAKETGDDSTCVCFTDFNEFVLNATMSNIALNIKLSVAGSGQDMERAAEEQLSLWLSEHAPLGAGDWNSLSHLLDDAASGKEMWFLPHGLPSDGMFDCILAAETTYSPAAAMDTARFIAKHLKKGTGVAYVATKRYYFGIGGGSDAFREGIRSYSKTQDEFQVDTLQVYDNGAGNIRELLRVRR
jgi:predicted nicotinamide N-methyase